MEKRKIPRENPHQRASELSKSNRVEYGNMVQVLERQKRGFIESVPDEQSLAHVQVLVRHKAWWHSW